MYLKPLCVIPFGLDMACCIHHSRIFLPFRTNYLTFCVQARFYVWWKELRAHIRNMHWIISIFPGVFGEFSCHLAHHIV